MFEAVKTRLVASKGPISGVVRNGPHVLTAQIPKDPSTGDIVQGDIAVQARRTLDNLRIAMEGAGGSLRDVMMVQVFLVEGADAAAMNAVWGEVFTEPFPCRATVVVKELLATGMLIEIIATAHLGAV
ncbi:MULTISPECIES: Rid family hydrolase [unclassified Mesorhizobium]|uniref:RidA family protein n=1 Tax=unclassified Mesorhizobium TaxID=325217 RepID=UPI0004CEC8E9|nr:MULTISPECIES: Rid family hydrolase [unclassified Mesorhizobium]WJI81099.1 Rid family hydrolase [Mesorhizobium sp. C374B]WJI87640.1 Rid family hydrolase [Mesorhizobium sp. C372A]